MDPFHGRGMDIGFIHRPRKGHINNADGADLKGEEVIRVTATQEKVGPDRRVDEVENAAQDAIFVNIVNLIKGL